MIECSSSIGIIRSNAESPSAQTGRLPKLVNEDLYWSMHAYQSGASEDKKSNPTIEPE